MSTIIPSEEIIPKENEKAKAVSEELTMGMLRDYVTELEEQKTKLLLKVEEYRKKLEQQESDQRDIYYYLNKKLDENYETIAALEEQILSEQADREHQEKALEKKIATLEQDYIAMESKLVAKLNDAEEKLNKLKEFGENKEELDRNLENLLDTLEKERAQFRALADDMDRRAVQERDKIRKEFSRQFEEYKKNLQDGADSKLSIKTKKTQAMNAMIRTELGYQSKQADQVLIYNQRVLEKDRELRQELELCRVTQTEMINRLALYQRLIKQLNERISSEESQSAETIGNLKATIDEKEYEIKHLKESIQALNDKSSRDKLEQDKMWKYILKKFGRTPGSHLGENSVVDIEEGGPYDDVLCDIVAYVLQKYPERFSALATSSLTTSDQNTILPKITKGHISSTSASIDRDQASNSLTGIQAWDNARSSKLKWWNSMAKAGDPSDSLPDFRNVGVQTDGQILPFPPGSPWRKRDVPAKSVAESLQDVPNEFTQESSQVKTTETSQLSGGQSDLPRHQEPLPSGISTNGPSAKAVDPLMKKRHKRRYYEQAKTSNIVNSELVRHVRVVQKSRHTSVSCDDGSVQSFPLSKRSLEVDTEAMSISGHSVPVGHVTPTQSS